MRVLVVEPDAESAESLVLTLRRHNHHAECVHTGADALQAFPGVDLVLLDLELPDIDGLEVCRAIRASQDTPIIAVTARESELDRVLGLRAGADDYLAKPYQLRELMARIGAVMRRVERPSAGSEVIERGPLRLDPGRREVRVDERLVSLTRKEFDLLHLLASSPDVVFSRQELALKVWEGTCSASSRTIDTHVSSVRTKLGASSWIVAVRGVGFRFGHGRPGGPPEPGEGEVEQCPHCGAPQVHARHLGVVSATRRDQTG